MTSYNKDLTTVPIVRCMVLGDQNAGKSILMRKYANLSGLEYNPQSGELTTAFNGQKCVFIDVDVPRTPDSDSGSEAENHPSINRYGNADVYLFCVSIANQGSVEETVRKILETVTEFIRGTPFVLVGTHIDRRTSLTSEDLQTPRTCPMPFDKAEGYAKRIGASKYIECSATTGEGVDEVFEESFQVGLLSVLEKAKGHKRKFSLLRDGKERKPSCIQQ